MAGHVLRLAKGRKWMTWGGRDGEGGKTAKPIRTCTRSVMNDIRYTITYKVRYKIK